MTPELREQFDKAGPELKALILRTIEQFKRHLAIAGSLTPNTVQAMADCVDDRLMSDIVSDFRSGLARPASMASTPDTPPPEPKKGTGFVDPIPIKPPPGVAICDQMMDVQDELDRRSAVASRVDEAIRSKLKGGG